MQEVREQNLAPKGYVQQSITSGSAVTVGTISSNAQTALIINSSSGTVIWRDDGTSPTTVSGMPLAAGGSLYYAGALSSLKFVALDTTSNINISYYG